MSDILIIRSKGQGQNKSFSPRNWIVQESEECLCQIMAPEHHPCSYLQGEIGPAKDGISSLVPPSSSMS